MSQAATETTAMAGPSRVRTEEAGGKEDRKAKGKGKAKASLSVKVAKRPKTARDDDEDDDDGEGMEVDEFDVESDEEEEGDSDYGDMRPDEEDDDDLGSEDGEDVDDEDEEIRKASDLQSSKTKKRKRRATSPQTFSSHLLSLLQPNGAAAAVGTLSTKTFQQPKQVDPTTLKLPKPRVPTALSRKSKDLLKTQKQFRLSKKQIEEKGHVTDVIGGWEPRPSRVWHSTSSASTAGEVEGEWVGGGQVHEAQLKRLAQKGVVRLFNAIKTAQGTVEEAKTTGTIPMNAAQKRSESVDVGGRVGVKEESPAPGTALFERDSQLGKAGTPIRVEDGDGDDEGRKNGKKGVGLEKVEIGAERKGVNVLGSRGKEAALSNLSKASFLELLRSGGGSGSKTVKQGPTPSPRPRNASVSASN